MKKIYHLSTCNTCQRIIGELDLGGDVIRQDIKTEKISEEELDKMAELSGSYESLFSRKAMKFRSMGLKEQVLAETDYRRLILEEYTFLKRPVVVVGDKIFVGNAKKSVAGAKEALS